MLLLHGWPGSFFEFHKAIPKLVAERDGYAFELVIPSLPGFGYSSAARKSGLGPDYVGLIMKKLMHRLGHKKFYVQGGDFGSEVARMIARIFPEYAISLFFSLLLSAELTVVMNAYICIRLLISLLNLLLVC